LKAEKAIIAEVKAITVARGIPSRLARIEARVCSCQVTGNQYSTCVEALTPANWICCSMVMTTLKIRISVGRETKKLRHASVSEGNPRIASSLKYIADTAKLASKPPATPIIAATQYGQ
jgi:hypothetical protein